MGTETIGEGLGPEETALRTRWAQEPEWSQEDFNVVARRRDDLMAARVKDHLATKPYRPSAGVWVSVIVASASWVMFAIILTRGWPVSYDLWPLFGQSLLQGITFSALGVWVYRIDRMKRITLAEVAAMTPTFDDVRSDG